MYEVRPRKRVTIHCKGSGEDGQGRTHQEFREKVNINAIIKRWRSTGELVHVRRGQAMYGDFTDAPDYRQAVEKVMEAEEQFMKLPSAVRNLCKNDPALFMEALGNEEQLELLEKAGLVIDRPAVEKGPESPQPIPDPTPPVPEPEPAPAP